MARRARIKAVKVPGRPKPWKVELQASQSGSGRRERFFFPTKAEADGFAEEQRVRIANFGTVHAGAGVLSPAQVEQAKAAFDLLAPLKVSLNEAVRDYVARRTATDASVPFEDAFATFETTGRRSASYARSLRQTRNRLTTLHGRQLNTITPAMIEGAIADMKPSVRNFTLRILGGLFMLGIKRDWCAENPCKRVDMAQREAKEIAVYTPEEVAKIMATTAEHEPELIPFMAISFFAGLRLAEVQRLEWSAIELPEKFLKLPASITKTKRTRHVDLAENAIAWLTPYAGRVGKVVPFSPDALHKRQHALAEKHGVPTIKHGARHAFASYWLAEHGDVDRLCLMLGHESPEMTFKHYAKAATKREAKKFWSILPAKAANVVAFKGEAA
jgi:integrase